MTSYLIIDDEHIAHDIIKGYCDLLPNMELKKNCYDAIEAMDYLRIHQVDLIFLDLNMPKLKGFEFLKTLQNPPNVIVTTAYSEHALEGYELNIVDYLLKPFSFERFLKAVNKAVMAPSSGNTNTSIASNEESKTVFLRSDKKHTQVALNDIQFLESSGNYVKVIAINDIIMVRDKISNLLQSFDDKDFVQVHKSFAVARRHIHSIEGNRIFIGDHTIPIGKMYRMNINTLLD